MMKKLTYLFSIIAMILFMACSCEKEDPTPDPDDGHITLSELNGSWDFISYTYQGTEYDCESSGVADMNDCFYNLEFDGNEVTITNGCENGSNKYDFTKDVNTIKFDDSGPLPTVRFEFTVISYDGTELKLRLDETPFIYDYLGGTLTLVK